MDENEHQVSCQDQKHYLILIGVQRQVYEYNHAKQQLLAVETYLVPRRRETWQNVRLIYQKLRINNIMI